MLFIFKVYSQIVEISKTKIYPIMFLLRAEKNLLSKLKYNLLVILYYVKMESVITTYT
jgi:hypothetical protein